MELDPQLVDPICEGSIVQVDVEHRRKMYVYNIWSISDWTLHSLHKSSNVFCQVSDFRLVCEKMVSVNFSFQRLLFHFRANLSLALSLSGGEHWDYRKQVRTFSELIKLEKSMLTFWFKRRFEFDSIPFSNLIQILFQTWFKCRSPMSSNILTTAAWWEDPWWGETFTRLT